MIVRALLPWLNRTCVKNEREVVSQRGAAEAVSVSINGKDASKFAGGGRASSRDSTAHSAIRTLRRACSRKTCTREAKKENRMQAM